VNRRALPRLIFSRLCLLVDWDDGSLVFRQQVTEAQDRAIPVLDVAACGYRNTAMTQLFAGGEQP
jgi:hypothetical protein